MSSLRLYLVMIMLPVVHPVIGQTTQPASSQPYSLIRQTLSAPPRQRPSIWQEGIRELGVETLTLSDQDLIELEKLVAIVEKEETLTGLHVLTDVFLLAAPDVPSMHAVLKQRIAALVRDGKSQEAQMAARLSTMLAIVTPEGPREAAQEALEILPAGGMTSVERERLKGELCWGPRSGPEDSTTDVAAKSPATMKVCAVDADLKTAAAAMREAVKKQPAARRSAFLNLFAGNSGDAAENAYAALAQTPADPQQICLAFEDIGLVLAIADGRFDGSHRFAQWLADGQALNTSLEPAEDPLLKRLIQCERKSPGPAASTQSAAPATYADLPPADRVNVANLALQRWDQRTLLWGHRPCGTTKGPGPSSFGPRRSTQNPHRPAPKPFSTRSTKRWRSSA